jgi:hypothetical protein
VTRRAKAPGPNSPGNGDTAPELGGQHHDQVVPDDGAVGTRAAWVGGNVSGIVSTGDNAVNINQVTVLPSDAVSPSRPGDPDRLGLVENPLQVLGLGPLEVEARSLEASDPLGSARRYGVLADELQEANFPGHAAGQRIRQAQLLHAGGDVMAAFAILWSLALEEFASGAIRQPGGVVRGMGALRPGLGDLQAAKLAVLNAAQDWYQHGSLLAVAVPALEVIVAEADADAAFLVCAVLEQAVVDGWFDFDPPYSLVTPGGNTADLLARLLRCTEDVTCTDVVIRARLACAVADADLAADSTAAQAEAVYAPILRTAGAGRYLHAGGLVSPVLPVPSRCTGTLPEPLTCGGKASCTPADPASTAMSSRAGGRSTPRSWNSRNPRCQSWTSRPSCPMTTGCSPRPSQLPSKHCGLYTPEGCLLP